MLDSAMLRPLAGVAPYLNSWAVLAAGALLLPFVLTYLFTAARYFLRLSESGDGAKPPPMPYWIPFVGNTIAFSSKMDDFLLSLSRRFPTTPIRLSVGFEHMHFVPHGEMLSALFKNSRDLTAKPITLRSLRDSFGVPDGDLDVFRADDSGIGARPLGGYEGMDPKLRAFHTQHRDLQTLLMGTPLNVMTEKFVELFIKRIETSSVVPAGDEWTRLPDLYLFLKREMFTAAMEALCGDNIFRVSPGFCDHFWAFDANLPTLFKRIPRWLAPKAYAVRDVAIADVQRWQAWARDNLDWSDGDAVEAEWEPVYGARLMRARQTMFDNLSQSPRARASNDFGMIWATNGNVIPATMWALLWVLTTPGLEARVRAEIAPCVVLRRAADDDEAAAPPSVSLAIAKLVAAPLMTSIYMEVLRLRVGVAVVRSPLVAIPENRDGFRLGRWLFPKESLLFSLSWTGHYDAGFWNEGRPRATGGGESGPAMEHPTDAFWAERFLEYPDDALSGPVRKEARVVEKLSAAAATEKQVGERTAEDDRKAKVATTGIQGHWFPYGGGTKMCPGRFFAKQEMMAAVAVMLTAFEIEFEDPAAAAQTKPDMAYFPFGALPPDRKLPVRIRRRKLD